MKIVDYKILSGEAPVRLNNIVKEHLKIGFQPKGDVFINSDSVLHQTMVKYEEIPILEMSSFDSDRITNCLMTGINDGLVQLQCPCNEMCMSHAQELRDAHGRANKLTYENDDLMRENEQLKEKLKAYEADEIVDFENCSKEQLSAENVQYFKEIEKLIIENKELIKENDILNKIIYAFVANNYRYDEEEGYWIALDNSTFQCDSTARSAFLKIINQIKEKFNNENNN